MRAALILAAALVGPGAGCAQPPAARGGIGRYSAVLGRAVEARLDAPLLRRLQEDLSAGGLHAPALLRRVERLLDAEASAGMELTEHGAMRPNSSVSGLILGHPDSTYFAVGRIDTDQVADYAARKGWTVPEAERWLGPLLG